MISSLPEKYQWQKRLASWLNHAYPSVVSAVKLDEKGLIVFCPQCDQRNRIPYGNVGQTIRCAKCKTTLPSPTSPISIQTQSDFEHLINSSARPVLVDFWAAWCGPCKMVAPEIANVAARAAGKFLVAKVNTEECPSIAQRFRIASLPTLALFWSGTELARTLGARPAAAIEEFVQQTLAGK